MSNCDVLNERWLALPEYAAMLSISSLFTDALGEGVERVFVVEGVERVFVVEGVEWAGTEVEGAGEGTPSTCLKNCLMS